jgi:hypothetical protein
MKLKTKLLEAVMKDTLPIRKKKTTKVTRFLIRQHRGQKELEYFSSSRSKALSTQNTLSSGSILQVRKGNQDILRQKKT